MFGWPRDSDSFLEDHILANSLLLIPIYVQQDATLHRLLYLETVLHVSGRTSSHHQERIQLYLQHLVFVRPLLLPAAIETDRTNALTNTRCCRYSCLRSWWWVEVPPKTCRAVSRYNKLCNVASCWVYFGISRICLHFPILTCVMLYTTRFTCDLLMSSKSFVL